MTLEATRGKRLSRAAACATSAELNPMSRTEALSWVDSDLRFTFLTVRDFHFFETVLHGVATMRPREQRVLAAVNDLLGEAIGQLYVARAFAPEKRARAVALVGDVQAALRERLEHLDWMSSPTRQEAIRKLDAMRVKIGHPSKWRNYSGLALDQAVYAENVLTARTFQIHQELMIETVDRFGLKARFLHKHKMAVGRFFRLLSGRVYRTETAAKWGKRFEKNRASLFTFLDYDDVPWNNNNAEHAIKAFALLRRDFGGVSTEKGIREYLILLSVCETCKYMGVDFLDFLRSGETDIYAFARGRAKREMQL